MFVVNFDFSDHFLPSKLLAINIPVLLTELITYPFQRLQTLLISQSNYITKNQIIESRYIIRNMLTIEGFPKMLHGMRYSIDYMATQMTTKFLLFDFLMQNTQNYFKQYQKWKILSCCYLANTFSTVASQIAFNYQTIASSLPISKQNRPENVKIRLSEYTTKNKLPIKGLKYTIPVSLINTTIQLGLINHVASQIYTKSQLSYSTVDFLIAFLVFSTTGFVNHYAFQRQVQICQGLKERSIPYSKGLFGSVIRYNLRGMTLFTLYFMYFQWQIKKVFQRSQQRSTLSSYPQAYRKQI